MKKMKGVPYPKVHINEGSKYIGIFKKQRVEHEIYLVLHVFILKETYQPLCQVFFRNDEFSTVMADGTVTAKTLQVILDYNYGNKFTFIEGYAEEFARECMAKYLSKHIQTFPMEKELKTLFISYQFTVKEQAKHAKRRAEIARKEAEITPDMNYFRKINEKVYAKRVKRLAFSEQAYIFFDKETSTGYCNMCDMDMEISEDVMKHNVSSTCPCCKTPVTMKNVTRGRACYQYVKWTVKAELSRGRFLTRYFVHTWDLSHDYRNQNITTKEMIRSICDENFHRTDYSYERDNMTKEEYWSIYKKAYGSMGGEPSEYVRPQEAYLYNTLGELTTILNDGGLRYSALDIFLEQYMDKKRLLKVPYMIDHYISYWSENPFVEKFVKIGFMKLVYNFVFNSYDYARKNDFLNKEEDTLHGMLRIPRGQFKWLLQKGNPSYKDVEILRQYPGISEVDFFELVAFADYQMNYDAYMECRKKTTFHKIRKYLSSQNTAQCTVRYYMDYLNMAGELGYNLKNNFNLFPKNLVERHDLIVAEHNARKDEIKREKKEAYDRELAKYAEVNQKALENGEFADVKTTKFLMLGDLMIRLPKSVDEIKQEGEALKHCVGSYINSVVSGTTEIYFIRKVTEPDKPFYTLEWKNNTVKQCYGIGNCDKTPEVEAFVNTFSQLMVA